MHRIACIQLVIIILGAACGRESLPLSTQRPETEVTAAASPASENSVVTTSTDSPLLEPASAAASPEWQGETSSALIAYYASSLDGIEIYTTFAGKITKLTAYPAIDDSPAVSPDSTLIAFLSARDDSDLDARFPRFEIYLVEIDGENLRRLTNTEASEDHPAWSPDGQRIIFDADYDNDGFYELYTINIDGTALTRLTSTQANDQFADWSPDGTQIAFSSDRNGGWDIFVMDAVGQNQHALTDSEDWELFPAWSPDGRMLAFNKLAPRSRNTDIFVMAADGADILQLTDSPGFDENPAWSPDGSLIAFQTDRGGSFDIYVMAANGADQRPLIASNSDELWPSWGQIP